MGCWRSLLASFIYRHLLCVILLSSTIVGEPKAKETSKGHPERRANSVGDWRCKPSTRKGVASRRGPESWAVVREDGGLSVGRGRCRPSMELRNHSLSAPTLLGEGEGNTGRRVTRERRSRRSGVVDLAHVRMSSMRDSGGPVPGLDPIQSQAGSGEVEATPGRPQGREVGQGHRSEEVGEQWGLHAQDGTWSRPDGAHGAKGLGREEGEEGGVRP